MAAKSSQFDYWLLVISTLSYYIIQIRLCQDILIAKEGTEAEKRHRGTK